MAHQKSFGLGQRKTVRSLRASQALAQRVWTVLLSSVTCSTVLGLPSILSSVNVRDIAIAQTATPPVLSSALPQASSLTIEGAGSLAAVNQVLKENFEGKYQKTPVAFVTNGTAAGLQASANGRADLAAIGRSLTPDEKAQGFISIPINREKIALLVSQENPFRGSLTVKRASANSALILANNSPDRSFAWLPWILGLGLIGGLAWWLLKDRGDDAANLPVEPPIDPTPSMPETLDPVVPVTDSTTVSPTIASTNSINPVDPNVAIAVGTATVDTTGTFLLDKDSRSCESIGSENPVNDNSIVAVDHDVDTHGAGTVQMNPRDRDGNSGGLKFPTIESAIPPQNVAIAGVAGMVGVAVAGLAGEEKLSDGSATNANAASPLVPALILPHEPITQLPPDIHAPLESASPATNLSTSDPTIAESKSPQLDQPDLDGLPNSVGIAAGVVAGIIAGAGAAVLDNAVLVNSMNNLTADQLADVDHDLPDLVSGYGESRIVLMPRDPQWAYTYWDIPDEHRQSVRYLGGEQLALRLYDATDLDLSNSKPHSVQQYACDESARDWYLPIPVSDRDYITEIGYLTGSGEWLILARSNRIGIPPVYPTDWMDDQSITVDWEEPLQGKTFLQIVPPGRAKPQTNDAFHEQIFNLAYGRHEELYQEPSLVGSFFGSMHQVPSESLSSFVFPAGAGLWANEFPVGLTPSGIGMSGIGMSGIGMSGIGMGASIPPDRSRKFWLVADAELIVYGATEPDAQLTIGGVPVQLTPEGTFRIQLSFQDGNLDFPIMAIAKDGEQMRQVRMTFDRNTPLRKTNSKEDATDERY